MNLDALSMVKFGDEDSLKGFMFENGIQHQTFAETIGRTGTTYSVFPLLDANVNDLEDWLLSHQVEHQAIAQTLNLSNPVNLMDSNWNDENSFYDWLSTHLDIHQQIISALGIQ